MRIKVPATSGLGTVSLGGAVTDQMKTIYPTLQAIIFSTGIFLILVNLVGLSTTLRNPAIYKEHDALPGTSQVLSEKQLYDKINTFDGNKAAYC